MSHKKRAVVYVNRIIAGLSRCAVLGIAAAIVATGCSSNDDKQEATPLAVEQQAKAKDLLVFADELHTTDESINRFVARAMRVCAAGEYAPFRLLWSVREEPLPRAEYEKGWQAVQEVRIRLLEQVRLAGKKAKPATGDRSPENMPQDSTGQGYTAEGESAYVVCAQVTLDEMKFAGAKEPVRQVVLLIVRERNDWRFLGAPKKIRTWVRDKLIASDEPQEPEPHAQSAPEAKPNP